MALTSSKKYMQSVVALSGGQVVTLPGDDIFVMPSALPDEVDLYDIDTIQRYPLGTKLAFKDNVYRYAEYGGTTAAGDMVQAEAPDAAHDDLNPTGSGAGAGVAAGSKIISSSDTITLVQDEYAGGYLVIEGDLGEGYLYHIESNDAAASNALYRIKHGLAIAIDSTSDMKLIKSRYKEIIQMPTAVTAVVVGSGMAVGANGSFGWACTRGPAAVLTDGTVVIGQHVRASDGTAGAVEALDRDGTAEDEPEFGYVMDVGPTAEYSVIFLTLE